MDLQKINIKLFIDSPAKTPAGPFMDIFSRWREEKDEWAWVDLADYGHIVRGPIVVLIGRQGNLSLDTSDPGAGLLWANKSGLEGSPEERLNEAFRRTLVLSRRLVSEAEYPSEMAVRPGFWQVVLNDRLVTPHTRETHAAWIPVIQSTVDRLFGPRCQIIPETDPGRRYGAVIHTDRPPAALADLSARLNGAG